MDKKYLFALLCILILAGGIFLYSNRPEASSAPVLLTQEINLSINARLKIPTLGIDALVESVGLTKDRKMDVPSGPDPVGWYNLGTRPGEVGSAVIDGHSGYKDNIPAVFDNLNKLKIGDKIYIEEEEGTSTTFVVREIRTFDPSADASKVFFSTDGIAHLNLITCSGDWNAKTKTHSDRLVVFADKVI